jgi:hypothetical protein
MHLATVCGSRKWTAYIGANQLSGLHSALDFESNDLWLVLDLN